MKLNSSKYLDMESKLDQLKLIQKLTAPESLYDAILWKIEMKNKSTISPKWATGIAAGVILLFSIELFQVIQKSNKNADLELEQLIPKQNFNLYE